MKLFTVTATTCIMMMSGGQALNLGAGTKQLAQLKEGTEAQYSSSSNSINNLVLSIQSNIATNTQALTGIVSASTAQSSGVSDALLQANNTLASTLASLQS